jgi:hypothetical protein
LNHSIFSLKRFRECSGASSLASLFLISCRINPDPLGDRNYKKEFDMADYSFVKDPDGQILGLWIRDTELARSPIYITTLLKKHQGRLAEIRMPISDELIEIALSQNYRIVANGFDQQGGCFVMFGQASAPGEENKSESNLTPKPTCSICGNVGMPGDRFCRKCGNPIRSEIHCEKCGNIVQPKDLYCVKCGSRLGSKNVEAKPAESAEITSRKQPDATGARDDMKHSPPEEYSRKSNSAVGTQYDLVMVICDIDPLDKNAYLLSILNILQLSLSKDAQGIVKQHPDARILDKVFPYSMAYALTHFRRISLELDDDSIRYMQFEYPQNSITIGGYAFWMCGKKP